jgi:hypothetical protein
VVRLGMGWRRGAAMSKRGNYSGGPLNARIEWLKATYPTAKMREKRIRTLWKRIESMKGDVESLQRNEAKIQSGNNLIGIRDKMKKGQADIVRFQGEVEMLLSLGQALP